MSNKTTATGGKKTMKSKGLGRGLGSLIGENTKVDVFARQEPKKEEQQIKVAEPKVALKKPAKAKIIARPGEPVPETVAKEALTKATIAKAVESTVPEKSRIWNVEIVNVHPNKNQPRKVFSPEALKELADSIREKGIMQPIVCRKQGENSFEIIAGERRWRAAQAAGLHQVPVILKDVSNQEALELALIENIQRQDLNPIEEAEAYEYLMKEYNLTQQALAEKMGKERATVANVLRLLSLSQEVKLMVMNRELSLGQGKVLLALSDEKKQFKLAKKILKDKLSVRQTEKIIQKIKKGDDSEPVELGVESAGFAQKLIKGLEEDLQKTIGSKVAIDYNKGRGKISFSFYSDDELNDFAERLKKGWQK